MDDRKIRRDKEVEKFFERNRILMVTKPYEFIDEIRKIKNSGKNKGEYYEDILINNMDKNSDGTYSWSGGFYCTGKKIE